MSKNTAKKIQDWLEFYQKYMHLLDDEQQEKYANDMISGKAAPKEFKAKNSTEMSMKDLRKHFAEIVKMRRLEKGLKSTELSKMSGRSSTYITMIETCKRFPNIIDLQKLMKLLDIRPEGIFTILYE